MIKPFPLTRTYANWAADLRSGTLPPTILEESQRAFLNWVGCVFGGCQEEVTRRAADTLAFASGNSTLLGQNTRAGQAEAAFVNCLASSALAFDDTHLATVTHPTGPVAAALLARAEQHPVSGAAFLTALSIGIEIQCRLSNLLLQPPATPNLALYITGITGPVGAAAALTWMAGGTVDQISSAMGIGAAQSGGFRATHGSMTGVAVPAFAARNAVLAADLALAGVNCSDNALEDSRGFVGIFSTGAEPALAAAGLGSHFEMLSNVYKPYPAGIVLHAVIDVCLELAQKLQSSAQIAGIEVQVPPLTQALADRRHPTTPYEAPISLQHWAAHALHYRCAGKEGLSQARIDDPVLAALREKVTIRAVDSYARDEASAVLRLRSGEELKVHVAHATGSIARPLTDAQLDAKFLGQTAEIRDSHDLLARLRKLTSAPDLARTFAPWLSVSG